MNIMNLIKKNLPIIILAIVFTFMFFFRLDYSTLASWDEAWYGAIGREIVRSGDFIKTMWNGKPFYDHPPMGFWLIALSYKIFGISEFSTRFPSALLGLLSIILIYQTAFELFNKKIIGFASALIMGTSVWYVIRVRSGNLDSFFIFFFILTVFLSIKSSKNFNWFPLVMLSFGGLMLTKTLVGVSAIVLVLFFNWQEIIKIRKNFVQLIIGAVLFMLLVFPWYLYHFKTYQDFYEYHFIHKGTRNKELASYLKPMFEQPLFYLHMGVRKWYYLWLASLGFLAVTFKFIRKNIFFLFLWNFIILYPFLTSKETELWHLIPVYLPLSFIIAVGLHEGLQLGTQIFGTIIKKHFKKKISTNKLTNAIYLTVFLYIAFLQTKIFYKEVYPANKWISDDVAISKAAAKYYKPIFLDDDYLPIAIFYSGKNVQQLSYLPEDKRTLEKFIQSEENNYVVITRNWVVEDLQKKNIKYRLLEGNNSFSILTKP